MKVEGVTRGTGEQRRTGTGARLALLLLAALLLGLEGCKKNGKPALLPISDAAGDKLKSLTASPSPASQISGMHWPNFSDYAQPVKDFYDGRDYSLAWVENHRPTTAANGFIRQFQQADRKGLIPEDYDASLWAARVNGLAVKSDDADATFDAEMTVAVMRFFSNVHQGRVNPTHFNFEIDTASKQLNLPQLLTDKAVNAADVDGLVTSLEPDSDDYRKTEQALGVYLELARQQQASPQLATPLPPVDTPLKPGDHYAAMPGLLARLQLESSENLEPGGVAAVGGAANGDQAQTSTVYTKAAADAVKVFQETHGLTPNGQLTAATIKSLNVPMTARVQQLDDALERWRWLPEPYLHPGLLVNLPEFLLRGYTNDGTTHQLDFTMKVVVGKAEGGHDTPVFTHMMKYMIFRPFWNVPMSIIKKELMVHIGRSGIGYLAAKNFETVNNKGEPVAATAAEVAHGGVIVREKPGPHNSLGLVKFMFPNQYDIYLHSTPEPQLFNRTRRDFSHGCVRVQQPADLAVWVLRNQAGDWDLDKVQDAMDNGPDNRLVSLAKQIPVTIFYLTAHVDEQGRVDFFDDIYGYDKELDGVISKGMPYPGDVVKINPHTTPGDTT